MNPLALFGASRPVTQLIFNREGDLLFTASKDNITSVWYSINGERIGTYNGHRGAVFGHDVTHDSNLYVTASADCMVKLWNTETGVCLNTVDLESPQNSVEFSASGSMIVLTSEAKMQHPSRLIIMDIRDRSQIGENGKPMWSVSLERSKQSDVCQARWGPGCNTVIAGHINGQVSLWDARTGECTLIHNVHKDRIRDIQCHPDRSMFITASRDTSAKIVSPIDLDVINTFQTDRPVNSASISPTHNYVLLGGGQEAQEVTQSASSKGKFEARLFHAIYGDEFGRIKGHFGPINSITYSPDGKSYASGSEDGFVRLLNFDSTYFNFSLDLEE